jgi:lysophospholipase L1-like esterase
VWDHLGDSEHEELIAAERAGDFSRYRVLRLLRRATPGKRPRLTEAEFAEQIRLMIQWSRGRRSEPVLLVWPTQQQMANAEEIDLQQTLRRIATSDDVRIVDLVPVFRVNRGANLFVDTVHATKAGYALVAEALVPVLRQALKAK